MNHISFDSSLYEEEQEAYSQFIENGVKGLDDIDLITVHGLLARCGNILDKQHNLLDIVEDELYGRLSEKNKKRRW